MDFKFEKKDILALLGVFTIIFILFLNFKDNIYFPYADIGRELYIPSEILAGKKLYKDIFVEYAPAGFYLNALIIKIFGFGLQTFQYIGLTLSCLTITVIYVITKRFTDTFTAFSLSTALSATSVAFHSVSNFITPYSYSLMYAILCVFISACGCILYNETNKRKYLYAASVLFGLSICFKYDCIGFFLIFPLLLIMKKEKIKTALKTLLCIFLFPIFILIFQLINGVSAYELKNAFELFLKMTKSETVTHFYNHAGIIPGKYTWQNILNSVSNPNHYKFFYTLGMLNIMILLCSVFKRNGNLIVLSASAVLISLKTVFGINLEIYGTYFLPILLASAVSFLYVVFVRTKVLGIILLLIFGSYLIFDIQNNNLTEITVDDTKIKIPAEYAKATEELTDYILKNTTKEDKVLVLPEGVLINVLTNRESDNCLFNAIPPLLAIYGNDYTVKRIKTGNIKYLVLTNIMYEWYGKGSFKNDFGEKAFKETEKDYELKKIFGDEFMLLLYEKKRES